MNPPELTEAGVAAWLGDIDYDGNRADYGSMARAVLALVEAKVRHALELTDAENPTPSHDQIVKYVLASPTLSSPRPPLASPVEGEAVAWAIIGTADGHDVTEEIQPSESWAVIWCARYNADASRHRKPYRVVPLYAQASPSPSRLAAALLRECRRDVEMVEAGAWLVSADDRKKRANLLASIDKYLEGQS